MPVLFFLTRNPHALITTASAGQAVRAEVDSGSRHRQEVRIKIQVVGGQGTGSNFSEEDVYVGDGPIEYVGPVLPEEYRGRRIRVRVEDPYTGELLADDIGRIK